MTVRRGRPAEWQVAVPSYQRPDMLTAKTLPWLTAGDVPPDRVTIFCHDHDAHLPAYRDVTTQAGVRLTVTHGLHGLRSQRLAMLDHYPPGTPLLQADDDVTALVGPRDGKLHPLPDVAGWAEGMFTETASRDLWVWGVAPVANAFFLREGQVSEGLKFCIGTVWGAFTRPGHPIYAGTAEVKDDYEMCLRAWWYDGAVVRADGVAPKADHYSPGGCAAYRTPELEEAAARILERDFPGLVRRNTKRTGPYPEVLLARRRRGPRRPPTAPLPGAAALDARPQPASL